MTLSPDVVPRRPSGGVDLLLTNATVASMRPSRPTDEAVAIIGDRIAWVGSAADARRDLGPIGRTVDLDGATVLPGFIDAHNHLILLGHWLDQVDCSVAAAPSISGIIAAIAARARTVPAGTWIEGRGYDDTRLAERRHPSRADLDEATRDHPVLLHHISGHMSVVNSRGCS